LSIKAIKNAELFRCFSVNFKDFGGFFILEPFGLLNFLKTLLPSEEKGEQNTPVVKEETPPAPSPSEEEKENAYLHFIEAHERRAKRK
jgi:hypothetical protein